MILLTTIYAIRHYIYIICMHFEEFSVGTGRITLNVVVM